MKDTEVYINDQFPGRDFWVSFQSDFLRWTGNREINGVYLAKDGYYIEKWLPESFDESQLIQNTEAINRLAERFPQQKFSLMLAPTAGMILSEKLPKGAPMFDQSIAYRLIDQNLRGISQIPLTALFTAHKDEALYYKTDHHWTTYGAFLAYSAWKEANGQSANRDDFTVETVTQAFQGSLHSKVLESGGPFDSIEIYRRKEEGPYRVEYQFGKTASDTVYAMEQLSQKDKYQVFLNGNHPEITIQTSRKNGRRLLILKDSFANAFIPFLIQDYQTIHVIDPRYYNGEIDQYIADNAINECLILYNLKNFCEDKNIEKTLG